MKKLSTLALSISLLFATACQKDGPPSICQKEGPIEFQVNPLIDKVSCQRTTDNVDLRNPIFGLGELSFDGLCTASDNKGIVVTNVDIPQINAVKGDTIIYIENNFKIAPKKFECEIGEFIII